MNMNEKDNSERMPTPTKFDKVRMHKYLYLVTKGKYSDAQRFNPAKQLSPQEQQDIEYEIADVMTITGDYNTLVLTSNYIATEVISDTKLVDRASLIKDESGELFVTYGEDYSYFCISGDSTARARYMDHYNRQKERVTGIRRRAYRNLRDEDSVTGVGVVILRGARSVPNIFSKNGIKPVGDSIKRTANAGYSTVVTNGEHSLRIYFDSEEDYIAWDEVSGEGNPIVRVITDWKKSITGKEHTDADYQLSRIIECGNGWSDISQILEELYNVNWDAVLEAYARK